MKALFLTLFSLLVALGPIEENKQKFDDTVNNGYNSYYVMQTEETENYGIEIVLGKIGEEVTYSVQFTSATPNEYDLIIKFVGDNVMYEPAKDGRGDNFIYRLTVQSDLNLIVRTRKEETTSFTLRAYTLDDYNKLYESTAKVGLGNGLEKTKVKSVGTTSLTLTLSIIFGSIIVVSIIVILILSLTKKGLFNKKNLNEEIKDDFNYEEFVNNVMNQARQQQNMNNSNMNNPYNNNPYNNPNVQNPIEVEAEEVKEEEPTKEVYEKVRDYDIEEEKDVKAMLEKNGFNTDYANMSSDDKNKVMLELMRMKEFKEISEQDYRSEVIKLWM